VKGLTSLGLSSYPHSRIEMSRDADAGRRQKCFLKSPSACTQGFLFRNWQLGDKQSAEKLALCELVPRMVPPYGGEVN